MMAAAQQHIQVGSKEAALHMCLLGQQFGVVCMAGMSMKVALTAQLWEKR
jgi:hypothetical protein